MECNYIQAIKAARDYIASGNWWKGCARNRDKVCAVTALGDGPVVNFVENFVPTSFGEIRGLRPLAAFNDHPNTTLQDVIDLFDKALAELGGLDK